ncbi:MAG TPA: DUF5676 family membrane protein [Acidocella sp.]|jgi:hypothetical protein|nr:DUF5676 family membrane protein [Acidocella sp.]
MSQMQSMAGPRPGAQSDVSRVGAIPIVTLGLSLSLFFVISYVICIAGYLWVPGFPVQHAALSIFLPGFELLSWRSFCLGMAEGFIWGWYIALVFGSLYNFFSRRIER